MMIFVSVARDQSSLGAVVVIFLAVMAVNILCMLFATWILRCIGLTAMSALGGMFSILQAAHCVLWRNCLRVWPSPLPQPLILRGQEAGKRVLQLNLRVGANDNASRFVTGRLFGAVLPIYISICGHATRPFEDCSPILVRCHPGVSVGAFAGLTSYPKCS